MFKLQVCASVLIAMLSASSALSQAPASAGNSTSASSGNPYANMKQFAPAEYRNTLLSTIQKWSGSKPELAAKATKLRLDSIGTAYWLDTSAKVPSLTNQLKAARERSQTQKRIVTIVVYNLPNRDCAAHASNGELLIAQDGMAKYKTYVDNIAAILKEFPDVVVSAVVEPDSLPNLVTNMEIPKCKESEKAYKDGVSYAISKLQMPNVAIYLDIAHAGWLSYPEKAENTVPLYAEVVQNSKGKIRGFATNTANYNPLKGKATVEPNKDARAKDETEYVALLAPLMTKAGLPANFIIDTSRSGKDSIRTKWGNWCNIKGAGLGARPTWNTNIPNVDAFVWIKPPGESDGTSDPNAKRFDEKCASSDSIKNAPEAGVWNPDHYADLVANANVA